MKTTYYLRTLAATAAEKSTGEGGELNAVSHTGAQLGGMNAAGGGGSARPGYTAAEPDAPKFCAITDPTCEACQ